MKIFICRRAFILCGMVFGLFFQIHSHAQSSFGANCRAEIEKSERADKTGPFAIYQLADEKVVMEIKKDDLEKEFIFANYVDRGGAPFVGDYSTPKLITFRLNGKKSKLSKKIALVFLRTKVPSGERAR